MTKSVKIHPNLIMWLTIFSKLFAVWMFTKKTYFFLQHTTVHNSNLLEYVPIWFPLVLFHVTKYSYQKFCPCTRWQFFSIQYVARTSYKELIEDSQLIDEFERLEKGFIFVYLWDDHVTPHLFQDILFIKESFISLKNHELNILSTILKEHLRP